MTVDKYTWKVIELNFIAENKDVNPYLELSMQVQFQSPQGEIYYVPAFWDGNNNWKVRFAPNESGEWKWVTSSSDAGLHAKEGSFDVNEYVGTNPIYKHGFLKTSGRGFVHEDGHPFFWLGDTVWSVSAHAKREEWQEYLEFRSTQGFNVVQINSLPQWDASNGPARVPFVDLGDRYDFLKPNAAYFQYLDQLMDDAASTGMITAMVVLWFNYVPETNLSWGREWRPPMDEAAARKFAAYLSARYAAYGTVWLISGDTDYDIEVAEQIYDAAAEEVKQASPYPAMLTAHLNGGLSTPEKLNEKNWLDFHMLQSCHFRDSAEKALRYADVNRSYNPVRPVINGEPCYDSLRYMDKDNTEDQLIDREFVRETAWTSLLGGANSGLTYGAHGLWPWHRQGQSYGALHYGMPLAWQEALKLDSGKDMIRMQALLRELPWWELEPFKDLKAQEDVRIVASVTSGEQHMVCYVAKSCSLHIRMNNKTPYTGNWFNPENGASVKAELQITEEGIEVSTPDWSSDAVLLLSKHE